MQKNNTLVSVDEIIANTAKTKLLFAIQEHLLHGIFFDLSSKELEKLSTERELLVPITDKETIARLRLCDTVEDFTSIYMSLCELTSSLSLSFDIIPNFSENEVSEELQTPFLFQINTFSIIEEDPDDNPGGGDGGEDDWSPVAEEEEIVEVKAMSAKA